jgi:hypothetical protein
MRKAFRYMLARRADCSRADRPGPSRLGTERSRISAAPAPIFVRSDSFGTYGPRESGWPQGPRRHGPEARFRNRGMRTPGTSSGQNGVTAGRDRRSFDVRGSRFEVSDMGAVKTEWCYPISAFAFSVTGRADSLYVQPVRLIISQVMMVFDGRTSAVDAGQCRRLGQTPRLYSMIHGSARQNFPPVLPAPGYATFPAMVPWSLVGNRHSGPGSGRKSFALVPRHLAPGALANLDSAARTTASLKAIRSAGIRGKHGPEFPSPALPTELETCLDVRNVSRQIDACSAGGHLDYARSAAHVVSPSGLSVSEGPFNVK